MSAILPRRSIGESGTNDATQKRRAGRAFQMTSLSFVAYHERNTLAATSQQESTVWTPRTP
ncbi:MAG TPA: hypothetical protein VF049_17735 [Nocardioidaceae bacterium]